MDVDPDLVAAVAVEAWVMARAAAVVLGNPGLGHDAAVDQAIAEINTRYPYLGGVVHHLRAADIFGNKATARIA